MVNENDTLADDEIRYGDNDRIAALVANMVQADVLVLLTDTAGLFTADPRLDTEASLIEEVAAVDEQLESIAGGTGTVRGSGGMASKLAAAKIASWSGIRTVIAGADAPTVVADALAGVNVGTVVQPRAERMPSRKLWIAFAIGAAGRVVVDDGARRALVSQGRSLLAAGVRGVEGSFDADVAVEVVDAEGRVFAKGLTRYAAARAAFGGRPPLGRPARGRAGRGDPPRRPRRPRLTAPAGRGFLTTACGQICENLARWLAMHCGLGHTVRGSHLPERGEGPEDAPYGDTASGPTVGGERGAAADISRCGSARVFPGSLRPSAAAGRSGLARPQGGRPARAVTPPPRPAPGTSAPAGGRFAGFDRRVARQKGGADLGDLGSERVGVGADDPDAGVRAPRSWAAASWRAHASWRSREARSVANRERWRWMRCFSRWRLSCSRSTWSSTSVSSRSASARSPARSRRRLR